MKFEKDVKNNPAREVYLSLPAVLSFSGNNLPLADQSGKGGFHPGLTIGRI